MYKSAETREFIGKLKSSPEVKKILSIAQTDSEFFQRMNVWILETKDPYFYFKGKELNKKIYNQILILIWKESEKKSKSNQKKTEKKETFATKLSYSVHDESGKAEIFLSLEEWMKAFFLFGEFLAKQSRFNIYVSYVDSLIPAIFCTFGYLHSKYSSYRTKDLIASFASLPCGKELCFKTYSCKDIWELRTLKEVDKKQDRVLIENNKKENLIDHIKEEDIPNKVRVRGNAKMSSGRGLGVKMNDYISPIIGLLYGKEIENRIKILNEEHINILGRAVYEEIEQIMESLIFELPDKEKFYLRDILYFKNSETNFWNVEHIKSDRAKEDDGRMNVYIGENNALNYWDLRGDKNVIFADRKNIDKTYHEDLFDRIRRSISEEAKIISELENYFAVHSIVFPRGVEIVAW